jgi:predicted transglutaminase-like cysteine proteinase
LRFLRRAPCRPPLRVRAAGLCGGLALLAALAAQGAYPARLQPLQPLLQKLRMLDVPTQLHIVNQFFNTHIEFATDQQVWGQVDYWASPLEALAKGRGDCEDYAIAKYFSLVAAGMPKARLRLVYVHAQLDEAPVQAHMVLVYDPRDGGDVLILDNLVDEVLPAARRGDLQPVFSFNSDGLWQGVDGVGAGDPKLRLTRWRALLHKARAEGFL